MEAESGKANKKLKKNMQNITQKADVIGWISEDLAREIAEVSHFLYVVTLGYMHVYILPDGYTITHRINYN